MWLAGNLSIFLQCTNPEVEPSVADKPPASCGLLQSIRRKWRGLDAGSHPVLSSTSIWHGRGDFYNIGQLIGMAMRGQR